MALVDDADDGADSRLAVDPTDVETAGALADATSFKDFADKMGASDLQDLLECAAAYTAYVEGRPHFTHPQIMKQVAGMNGEDSFSREESLRSFGKLLRQGKIRKVKRGQFTISQSSQFTPKNRSAAS